MSSQRWFALDIVKALLKWRGIIGHGALERMQYQLRLDAIRLHARRWRRSGLRTRR
jgi:hypothetical protein